MEYIKTPMIVNALPWATAGLVISIATVLLALGFRSAKRMLIVLGLNVFVVIPLLGIFLAALAASPAEKITERAGVGGVIGAGTLIGITIGLAILGTVIGSHPNYHEFIRTGESHPEARASHGWLAPLGAVIGIFGGLVLGIGNLPLLMLAATVAGTLR